MKAIILKSNLKMALDAVSKFIGDGHSLPVLKNVLVRADQGILKICSTNLEAAVVKTVPGKVIEEGSITVPFSVINSIVSNIQNEKIEIEDKKDKLFIRTDSYEASIQGMSVDEYPIIPTVEEGDHKLEIKGSVLKGAVGSVIGACQISDLRPEISGILFSFEDSDVLKVVATDSFRLAEKSVKIGEFDGYLGRQTVIVPLKTIQEVLRVISDDVAVSVFCDDSQIYFKSEGLDIVSRIIGGDFPDYSSIIPSSVSTELLVNKEEFLSALKLVGVFTAKSNEIKMRGVRGKELEVYSADASLGENIYKISADFSGEDIEEVVFNWRFIVDGIKNCNSDNIFLGLQGSVRPAIIKPLKDDSYFYILMPVKS